MDKLPLGPDTPNGSLIPYYFQNKVAGDLLEKTGEFWCYNDIVKWGDLKDIITESTGYDPFRINSDTQEEYHIPPEYDTFYKIR